MASRNGSRRRGWQGLTTTQFVFGMLTVVVGAVIADQWLVPAFKQPVKLTTPETDAKPGVFARSSDVGNGVTFPIGTPNLLTTYETPPDTGAAHKIEGTNEELAAQAQPVRKDLRVAHAQASAGKKQANSSGGWLVDAERPVALPPSWQGGYFSAPVGGFRGFPGGIGNGSVKSGAAARSDS